MSGTVKNGKESIERFKAFVKRHPGLAKEVREDRKTWKEIYEEWYLFGEEDDMWQEFINRKSSIGGSQKKKDEKGSNDFINGMLSSLKKMDMNQMEKHLSSMSGAIGNVQQILEQFQSFKGKSNDDHIRQRPPFRNFRD
ncbi:YlbD family protein [Bacillus marinisedimentorum]|uniref:YlbD family protein n=1 Tax=Bacillus marinisedimentorum TaxID=1821260 RepID=UPI000872EAE0|nr:YlbD family protein [Bacillus marinisedimentorum]